MHRPPLSISSSSNAAHVGRRKNPEEVAMNFNFTRNDLAAKSSRELVHLFKLASQAAAQAPRTDAQHRIASALIAMIKAEQAKRGPAP
jgi:hypothetical protein